MVPLYYLYTTIEFNHMFVPYDHTIMQGFPYNFSTALLPTQFPHFVPAINAQTLKFPLLYSYLACKILWSTWSKEELCATWRVPRTELLFFLILSALRYHQTRTQQQIHAHTGCKVWGLSKNVAWQNVNMVLPNQGSQPLLIQIVLVPHPWQWPAAVRHSAFWHCSTASPPHVWVAATAAETPALTS